MSSKRPSKAVAVIDIGSSLLEMRISQLRGGAIQDLERLEYPLALGHEVFHLGRIGFDNLREISSALGGFAQVMKEYGVSRYKAVATTVFREAKNRAFLLDQLNIQNQMAIEVLEDEQEKTLIYSEILRLLEEEDIQDVHHALIAYIGTGSIGMAVYKNGDIVFSQNIAMGALKLNDMLRGIERHITDCDQVIDEYLSKFFSRTLVPYASKPLEHLIITGKEMEQVSKICDAPLKNGKYYLKVSQIRKLYESMRHMTKEKISRTYRIPEHQAEVLYSAVAIYSHMINLTKASYVIAPKIELWDAIIRQMLLPKSAEDYALQVRKNSIACATTIAEHYHNDPRHQNAVRTYAGLIFDRLKKLHGLDSKKRLLLELACILHECGYYVSTKNHTISTFDLIRNSSIYGLTEQEVLLIATIARYNEGDVPEMDESDGTQLSGNHKLIAAKLIAIFRLANALDKSQKQKIGNVTVRCTEDKLIVSGESADNVYLEQWAFEESAPFFEEVFGLSAELKVKSLLV